MTSTTLHSSVTLAGLRPWQTTRIKPDSLGHMQLQQLSATTCRFNIIHIIQLPTRSPSIDLSFIQTDIFY